MHGLDLFRTPQRLVAYDVGAAGVIPDNWRPFAPLLSVYAFDARKGSIQNPNASDGLELTKIECAVGGKADPARPFYVTRGVGGSSFFRLDPAWSDRVTPADYSELVEKITLPVQTLSDVIASSEAPKPHFLKLDIQGAELEVLRGLEPEDRTDIMGLVCEVEFIPVYKDQPLFEEVHREMRDYGLTIYDLRTHRTYRPFNGQSFSWYREKKGFARHSFELNGRLVAGDALYIRDFEDRPPQDLIEVKRLALVLLMHNFYDQAWAMVDASERDTIIDVTEAAALKQAAIDLCPEPKPYQRVGRRGKRFKD